jgi:hypothetical protein
MTLNYFDLKEAGTLAAETGLKTARLETWPLRVRARGLQRR